MLSHGLVGADQGRPCGKSLRGNQAVERVTCPALGMGFVDDAGEWRLIHHQPELIVKAAEYRWSVCGQPTDLPEVRHFQYRHW